MTRSRISMVVAAAGLVLVGMLAFVLFKPSSDDPAEQQPATKDDVKPIETAAQPKNPLYTWEPAAIKPAEPAAAAPKPEASQPVTPPAASIPKPAPATPVSAPKTGMIDYEIQAGDMISKLAVRYGCTSADIYRANDGLDSSNAHKLRVGQTIRIPVGGDTTVSSEGSTGTTARASEYYPRRVITAAAGDTALQLAYEHYGSMSLFRLIKDANPDLTWENRLRGGEQVVLPEYGKASTSVSSSATAPQDTVERSSLIPTRK